MYQVSQVQKERLCKDGRGQGLDAIFITAKGRGHKDGVQRYIEWPQLISLGT